MRRRKTGMGITILTVAILFVIISYRKLGLENKNASLKQEEAQYQQELLDLEDDKQDIENYRKYVQSDQYIEDVARKKLGLVYPDEIVFEADDSE